MLCKFGARNLVIVVSSIIWKYPKNNENSIPQNLTVIHITGLLSFNQLKNNYLCSVSLISSLWTTKIAEVVGLVKPMFSKGLIFNSIAISFWSPNRFRFIKLGLHFEANGNKPA
jgi:hypothetical protein